MTLQQSQNCRVRSPNCSMKLCFPLFLAALPAVLSETLESHSNLTWGTGGFAYGAGSQLPGVQVPYGALRLGPDTSAPIQLPFQHYGGYAFADSHVSAFSHTHLVGAGVADFGNFGFMATNKGHSCISEDCYKSKFSHDTETAVPGRYSVFLEDPGVNVTLAATGTHSGVHQYAAAQGSATNSSTLLLDVCHNAMADVPKACQYASLTVACESPALGNATCTTARLSATVHMVGSLSRRANGGYLPIYLHAIVSAASQSGGAISMSVGGWRAGALVSPSLVTSQAGLNTTSGSLGGTLQAMSGAAVTWTVRVGISFVSPSSAVANLQSDQCPPSGGFDCITFRQASSKSVASWGPHFAKLQAPAPSAGTPPYSWELLAAAWYRSAQAPTTYSESDGRYPAFSSSGTGSVGTVPAGVRALSDMSLWDIHRTQAPLMTLTDPAAALDTAWSLVNAWRTGGTLPVWPLANAYTGCMIGSHGVPVLADVAAKLGCNAMAAHEVTCAEAFAAANASVTDKASKLGMTDLGFVSQEKSSKGASHTLALAYDASAAASLGSAAGLGDAVLAPLKKLAGAYRNAWSAGATRMCPRWANGSFSCEDPDIPFPFEYGFTEGGSNQWSWFVPGDVPGLLQLWGGPTAAGGNLSAIMQGTPTWPLGNVLPNPFYWAGNEPDLLQIWLFNWMAVPAPGGASGVCHPYAPQAQLWAQWALRSGSIYSTQPSGIPGNDDYGTMAAWVVWASLGLYPVTGTPLYTLGVPQLPEASLQLASGHTLQVIVHNWTDVSFPANDAVPRASSTEGHVPSEDVLSALKRCAARAVEAAQPSEAHAQCTHKYLQAQAASAAMHAGDVHAAGKNPAVQGNAYVQSVLWNGQAVMAPFLQHTQIQDGGVLEFFVGPSPAQGAFCS